MRSCLLSRTAPEWLIEPDRDDRPRRKALPTRDEELDGPTMGARATEEVHQRDG
jgi:hypothetical protein